MKLHLPVALRKSVLLLCVVASTITSAWGGAMHENIAQRVYADFGQNRGRYKVNGVSTMLQAIRENDNLIVIPDNNPDTKDHGISLEQGMIDFSVTVDYGHYEQCYGAGSAFGSNYLVTVAHNPHFNACFGGYVVGSENTIKYSTVSVSEKDLGSPADWALYRQNKIYTDVVGVHNYSGVESQNEDLNENGILDIKEKVEGTLMYRAGGGDMDYWMSDGSRIDAGNPYTFLIGGIATIRFVAVTEENIIFADWNMNNQDIGVSEKSPLPLASCGGDSGTANYVYNAETGRYEYFFSLRAGNFTTYSVGHGSIDFANESMAMYSREVDMTETHTAYMSAVSNGTGTLTVGDTKIEHLAVNNGTHTWKDLSAVKDQDNWFAYGNGYMNSINGLGRTHNLLFDGGNAKNDIILNATVDTGVGYLEFNNGSFTIKNADGGNYTLNSAGYVINEGAEVHVQLTNDAKYMREWRKNGEGDLYIEGSGDNNILLAVGGSGTTYLNREGGGYAAYNVMAASGATVVIKDINQIERDFTFGLNGGTLDMNGNGMDWYTTHADADAIAADGFSINTLTDSAILTNTKGTTRLVYKQSGESTWLGSFKDTATGAIQIVADAGAGSVWTMNSICTDLTQNADSSFTVNSGTAVLAGTNTEHGPGSVQYSNDVWSSEHDWHYADAQMDVTVNAGGTFHLGTHARLKGDVTVKGGTYVMGEGVRHQMEYIEGGIFKEDTYAWAEYYGHHGNTTLDNGALKVQFDSKTTANTTYSGNITGTGTVSVDAGKGSLTLTGNNTFTGARSVENGTLIVEDAAAAGSGKWLVKDKGIFAAQNADGSTAILYIDANSTGVLALTQNQTTQINMIGHNTLILGAMDGMTINYGTQNTFEALKANANKEWRLGGGGGDLVVNYLLTGDNKLILGNGHTQGTVTLTNTGNNFTGGIDFASSGVTLKFTDPAAVDKISLNLTYANRATMAPMINNVTAESSGILLQNQADADIDMSKHASLFLGAEGNLEYTGNITVAEGQDYRFSAANGTFTVNSELEGNHNLVVDAQGFTGGTVKLTNASPITGSVTVTGAAAGSGVNGGNITLRIDEDGLLDKATGVYLQNGGTLHIGESTQHIHSLEMSEGSAIIGDRMDSPGDTRYSTLHLTLDSMDLKGTIDVNTIYKYGEGTLALSGNTGNVKYRELFIEEGNVKLTQDNASIGGVYINNSTFDFNGNSFATGAIAASNGAFIKASGVTIWGNATIGALEGTAELNNGGSAVTINGTIGASKDATLVLSGSGKWNMRANGFNTISEEGTLRVEDVSSLTFSYGTNEGNTTDRNQSPCERSVRIGGILDLAESVTVLESAASCDLQVLNFSTIKLNGQNLLLAETTNQAEWRINSLQSTGNETVTWETKNTKVSSYTFDIKDDPYAAEPMTDVNSSRLILCDESSFNGTLEAKRTADGRAYNSYVELAHEKALQNATLQLEGYEGANMALAVNADKSQIKGLNGNEHTLAYGGESYRVNQETAPTSTRDSILSITGSGTYEYKGAVAGLSIAMDGTGTQKFTGSNVSVADIHANAGRLEFASNTTVTGTIYLGKGGVLNMGERYSLNEGATLAIVGNQGSMEGTLVLNGGLLAFDSHALNAGTAQFNGTMVFAEDRDTQYIGILNPTDLDLSKTYTLFEGDWSGKKVDFHADTANYLKGNFTADANGLTMTLNLVDGFAEWKGNNYSDFAAGTTILFRNTEASKELSFSEPTTAAGLRFVNDETYTFSGSDVTLEGAVKMDCGKLVLNNKLSATAYEATGGTLEIASEGTLALTDTLTSAENRTATVNGITGTGTLQVKLDKTDNTYDNKLAIDAGFTGTTHVLEGNLTLNGSSFGSTLQLAAGVNAKSTEATTITGNLVLDGVSTINNGGYTLTINGSVTGEEGTWNRAGGSTLNINGEVNLGGFNIDSQYATTNFNGKTTIDTVTVYNDEAKMVFNGETSLGTVNLGQHKTQLTFNGSTEIGILNVGRSGGFTGTCTVNINADTAIGTLNIGSGADYKGDSIVVINAYTTADEVNLQHNNYTLQGSGTLETKKLNYNAALGIHLDSLTVVETTANERSWSENATTNLSLQNGAVLDSRLSYYKHYSGTLNIGGNDADGTMYMKGICLMPTDVQYARSVLNISKGAHLIIAGDKAGTTASDFVLAVGGEKSQLSAGSNVINVEGVLTSNAAMTLYYKSADVNVKDGGRLNLLAGLNLRGVAYNDWIDVNASVLVEEGGELYAAGGKNGSELKVSLAANTTLGAIGEADSTVTFSNNMSWGTDGKEGTITIDTAATTADENLQLVRSEDQGVTVDFTAGNNLNGGINLKGSTALEVIGSGALKHKKAFNKATAIRVQEGATLAVDSTAELTAGAELNKGGLALDSATVSGKDITITDSASIRATGGTSTLAANTVMINSAAISYDVAEGATLKSTGSLGGSGRADITKTGAGALHLNNAGNDVANIRVDAGSLSLYGAGTYNMNDLMVATGATLSFYAGVVDNQGADGSVVVDGKASFTTDSQLNGSLTLATGSTLDMAEGHLSLTGSLTLQQGITLGDATLQRIQELSVGEQVLLFTGVDAFVLDSTDYAQLTPEDAVLASDYFSNITSNNYVLTYTGANVGSLAIVMNIPEPATATLSLLALCGLAARRRRKV